MDLHLTADEPTTEEKTAVDGVLGPPESEGIATDGRVAFGGHETRARRHLLLPVLHAIQERTGWISPGALNYVAVRLDVAPPHSSAPPD